MIYLVKAAALAVVALSAPVIAHDYSAGSVRIGHPWTRETAPGQRVGAGYLTLVNTGKTADQLIAAATPAAARVEMHTMAMTGGVMRMRRLDGGITIAPGATVTLAPSGQHLMLIGLSAPLTRGRLIPITLRFARAGRVTVMLKVEAIGTNPAQGGDHGKH